MTIPLGSLDYIEAAYLSCWLPRPGRLPRRRGQLSQHRDPQVQGHMVPNEAKVRCSTTPVEFNQTVSRSGVTRLGPPSPGLGFAVSRPGVTWPVAAASRACSAGPRQLGGTASAGRARPALSPLAGNRQPPSCGALAAVGGVRGDRTASAAAPPPAHASHRPAACSARSRVTVANPQPAPVRPSTRDPRRPPTPPSPRSGQGRARWPAGRTAAERRSPSDPWRRGPAPGSSQPV